MTSQANLKHLRDQPPNKKLLRSIVDCYFQSQESEKCLKSQPSINSLYERNLRKSMPVMLDTSV